MIWLLFVVVTILLTRLLDEMFDCLPWLAAKIIERTARHLPTECDRYEQEWLAELETMPKSGIVKLAFAINIRWTSKAVGAALGSQPEATSPGGPSLVEVDSSLDLRLASIWSELFELPQEQWTLDLINWFLRAAYGQHYLDSLDERAR